MDIRVTFKYTFQNYLWNRVQCIVPTSFRIPLEFQRLQHMLQWQQSQQPLWMKLRRGSSRICLRCLRLFPKERGLGNVSISPTFELGIAWDIMHACMHSCGHVYYSRYICMDVSAMKMDDLTCVIAYILIATHISAFCKQAESNIIVNGILYNLVGVMG